jgi:hypothetical protein
LDEEESKHASLAQQNTFGPTFFHSLLRLVKGTTKPNTYQRRVIYLFAVPILVFYGLGLKKGK